MVQSHTNSILELAHQRRVRMLNSTLCATAAILLVFGVKAVFAGVTLRIGMSLLGGVLLFSAYQSVLKGRENQALTIFFFTVWESICVANVTVGHFESVVMCWWVIFVSLAGLLGGRRYCFVWAFIAFSSIIALWCAHKWLPFMGELIVDENKVIQLRMHLIAQLLIASVIVLSFIKVTEENEDRVLGYNKDLEQEVCNRKIAEEETAAALKESMQFLANMSHEVRTPLNSILGFSSRLLKRVTFTEEKDRQALERINKNCQGLTHLINEMFELSRISILKLEYSSEPFSVEVMMRDCLSAVEATAKKYSLALNFVCEGESKILADRIRLHQAIVNVIYFAIRQTNEGCITIKQSPLVIADGRGVQLEISDTSAGIPPEHVKELFETHYEFVLNSNKSLPISALTLVLSSKLIGLHKGTITVASELGCGTVFTICLPLSPTPAV